MEAYGHLYFQRVAGYEYLYKYYYIKLLCYCFIFCINNNTDKEHLKFNPCEYSSLSDCLICRLRYFLDDFVCHIPPKIPCTFTFFIIFGKNTKESILTCKILSYLFDFRSNTCVSRRHTVSELILASNSLPAGGGGGAEPGSTCFCSSASRCPVFALSMLSSVSSCAACVCHKNSSSKGDIRSTS